jgi:hypothetical protein
MLVLDFTFRFLLLLLLLLSLVLMLFVQICGPQLSGKDWNQVQVVRSSIEKACLSARLKNISVLKRMCITVGIDFK